ncbi:MAG: AMP-binding protein [Actinomycetota bacterium]
MADYVWQPSDEVIDRANVTRLARSHGLTGYSELLHRSREEIEWFWDAVVSDLNIEFRVPYGPVLDVSRGVQWPEWFVGGGINIAESCVDRWRSSGREAIVWEGEEGATRRLTYDELGAEVARVGTGLRSLGVSNGDAVGLFLPMVPEAVVTFLACCRIGAVVVPIFSGFAASAVAVRLNDARAKVLVCADGFFRRGVLVAMKETADDAAAQCASVDHVVVVPRTGRSVTMSDRDIGWGELFSSSETPMADTGSEDPFMIAYTSGTTGKPKGSVHVHGGFLVKIASEVAYQTDYQPGELLFWFTDPGWIMGPWEIIGTLALGGTIFLYDGTPDHPAPDRLWAMVERHGINILGVSPTLVRALAPLGDEHVASHDLSTLRILGSTGEPWNTEPYLWFHNVVGGGRCPIVNFSGGTEVGACFLSPTPVTPLKACSLGGPALGMAVDVFDADGKQVRGGVGELVCTKPWPGMTRGIWGDPDRYISTYWSRWPDVWVHGDWASIDDDGEWYLHGRSDDTLNVAGKRVGPAEIESVLVSHAAVVEAAVIGVPHDVKGEEIWCYVVVGARVDADEALRDDLSKLVERDVGKAFRPGAVRFVTQLPKTRNAKVLRRAVRAAALGADPGDLSSLENPSALEEIAAVGKQ